MLDERQEISWKFSSTIEFTKCSLTTQCQIPRQKLGKLIACTYSFG